MDPTRGMMIAIAQGCAYLLGHQVSIAELFELEQGAAREHRPSS